jgi:hypothetical protein
MNKLTLVIVGTDDTVKPPNSLILAEKIPGA